MKKSDIKDVKCSRCEEEIVLEEGELCLSCKNKNLRREGRFIDNPIVGLVAKTESESGDSSFNTYEEVMNLQNPSSLPDNFAQIEINRSEIPTSLTWPSASQTLQPTKPTADLSSSALFNWDADEPLSSSVFGNIPNIPSLQGSTELPPRQDSKFSSLPNIMTSFSTSERPQSGDIPILYVVPSPTKSRRPFSIATDTPSTSTPLTGSTEDIVDPVLFPKLRKEPISLFRRGATLQRKRSGKETEQETSDLDIQTLIAKDDEVNLQEVDNYKIYSIEEPESEQALVGVLDFYNGENNEKVASESGELEERFRNSIYIGLQDLEKELKELRKILPELDKEAEKGLETITEEIELETQEIENELEVRQSIYLEEEAVESLQELYQQEASKPGFKPKNFFRNVKKGVDKVKQTGQTVAQKVESSRGFQVANKAAGVVFNPTTANITKIVVGEVLKAVPGGVFVAGAMEGAVNVAGRIRERREELRKVQEEAKQVTEQGIVVETETTELKVESEIKEVQSDIQISTIESKARDMEFFNPTNVDDSQLRNVGLGEESEGEEIFEEEDEYPRVTELLNSIDADLKSVKKNTDKLNINDNVYFDRIMKMDARTVSFNNTLVSGVNEYQKSINSLKNLITTKHKSEGERYNEVSKKLDLLIAGEFPGKGDFEVGDNSGDESRTEPFDMINTARDIQKEVLNIKTDISKVNTWIENQEKEGKEGNRQFGITMSIILVIGFVIAGLTAYFLGKKNQKAKQVNSES